MSEVKTRGSQELIEDRLDKALQLQDQLGELHRQSGNLDTHMEDKLQEVSKAWDNLYGVLKDLCELHTEAKMSLLGRAITMLENNRRNK